MGLAATARTRPFDPSDTIPHTCSNNADNVRYQKKNIESIKNIRNLLAVSSKPIRLYMKISSLCESSMSGEQP